MGIVFGFELYREFVGTIRIVPLGHQLTLTEVLLPQTGVPQVALARGGWEVARLVLSPDFRSDVDTLRHCLYLALRYAHVHAQVHTLYAACTHVLSRLYRRFGFQSFAKDVPLAGTKKTYTLIQGAAFHVLTALTGRNS